MPTAYVPSAALPSNLPMNRLVVASRRLSAIWASPSQTEKPKNLRNSDSESPGTCGQSANDMASAMTPDAISPSGKAQ